jgi:hypothetical protein
MASLQKPKELKRSRMRDKNNKDQDDQDDVDQLQQPKGLLM